MNSSFLEVHQVHKAYGRVLALQGVDLQVAEGEIFGLLGPNGAGKTTLLSILSCLLKTDAGMAHLLGQPLEPSAAGPKRMLGIVPQDLALYGELTARENLAFFGRLYGLTGHALENRVGQILESIGLIDRAEDRVDTFSGGMKRRLNLGAALVHGPRLLLMDEPTIGVDPQSRNHIFQEIKRLHQDGVTIVYTSHYMDEVQTLCSRIGIIDRGRLIACDTLPALLRQLPGVIRFRVPARVEEAGRRCALLPEALIRLQDEVIEVTASDIKGTLLRIIAILNEMQLELISLETEEPNLERVFLSLTGRALRD